MNPNDVNTPDWPSLHARLAQSQKALSNSPAADAERRAKTLRERARQLAITPTRDEDELGYLDIVEFQLSYERHAVEGRWVTEVWALRDLAPLPGTPSFIAGIIHLRGRIVTVINPKEFFQLPSQGLPDANRVLLLSDGTVEFGFLVDSVAGTKRIGRSALQSALPTLTGLRRDFLLGITADPIVVLDAKKILRDERLTVNDTATSNLT